MSGAAVHRYAAVFAGENGRDETVRLVVKEAPAVERRTLARLHDQRQPNVPFSHTRHPNGEETAPLCLQDLGDEHRPPSLDPAPPELVRREAAGLAAIHAANLGRREPLGWLPSADRAYVRRNVEDGFFRPAWERALADDAFVRRFAGSIAAVEAVAAGIVDEMEPLLHDEAALTLVHTDINPSNVLVKDETPFFVDWASAHYGPFYLDLPHHLCTRDQAELYRTALAGHGITIAPDAFAARYRTAARYTAPRYCWWALDAWHDDHAMSVWVARYLRMVTDGS
jgi:aminoglycoside phosphotransferase (APT) family kinase protein